MIQALSALARRSLRGSVFLRLVRMVALCVVVALVVQIGECALDACGECVGHHDSTASHNATPAAAGGCHNCICIGTTSLQPTPLLPPLAVTLAALLPLQAAPVPHPSEPFIPPRLPA